MASSPTRLRSAPALLLLLAGCASLGNYVWVDDYKTPSSGGDEAYLIAPGDVLNVRVYNQDGMSARVKVRADGKVSLPFLADVAVVGQAPGELARRLQVRLKEFVNAPVVTVSLEEAARLSVPVMGEVVRPGLYQVDAGAGPLHALAQAGGLTEFGHSTRIFVLRSSPEQVRVRFTLQALEHADGMAARFRLRDGDVLVVE